jgi:hypothetical protein
MPEYEEGSSVKSELFSLSPQEINEATSKKQNRTGVAAF